MHSREDDWNSSREMLAQLQGLLESRGIDQIWTNGYQNDEELETNPWSGKFDHDLRLWLQPAMVCVWNHQIMVFFQVGVGPAAAKIVGLFQVELNNKDHFDKYIPRIAQVSPRLSCSKTTWVPDQLAGTGKRCHQSSGTYPRELG